MRAKAKRQGWGQLCITKAKGAVSTFFCKGRGRYFNFFVQRQRAKDEGKGRETWVKATFNRKGKGRDLNFFLHKQGGKGGAIGFFAQGAKGTKGDGKW